MTQRIECEIEEAIAFDAFVEALHAAQVDVGDEAALISLAPLLKQLSNNADFLADRIVAELENRFRDQAEISDYGMQVLMLCRTSHHFVRANFWPARNDSLMRASGSAPFFYDLPHDHNFSFLTVGHFGPGYWSDYYEYRHEEVAGYPGEPVDLVAKGRRRLQRGQLMLYRAHRDIHRQLPPDRLSVSLNIVESTDMASWYDQYSFDLERGEIGKILSMQPAEILLDLASHIGGEAGIALVDEFARDHPVDRVRFRAISAAAAAASDKEASMTILAEGCNDASAQVSHLCRQKLGLIERDATH